MNTTNMTTTASMLDSVMRVIDRIERDKMDRRAMLEVLTSACEDNPDLSKRLWVALKLAGGEYR